MSYESFRSDLVSRLSVSFDSDQILTLLSVMDNISVSWDFLPKSTALSVSDGIPDVVRLYIASKSIENRKKKTLENYLSTLTHFFTYVRRPVDQITTNDIRIFINWYKESRHVTSCTLEHVRIIINTFFSWCVDEEIIRKNPCKRIQPIKQSDPERLPMTALELEKVRNSCRTLREKALVDFLYSSAARVSELCALDRDRVNFIDHTIHIEHGKGDKGRTTYLNAESEISLRSYLASRTDDNPALFVSTRFPYARLSIKSVQKEISRIISRCNLSVHVTPHIFRHTAASLALQRGMPIDQVQRFLGHARIQTTLRYAKTLDLDVKLSHQRFIA